MTIYLLEFVCWCVVEMFSPPRYIQKKIHSFFIFTQHKRPVIINQLRTLFIMTTFSFPQREYIHHIALRTLRWGGDKAEHPQYFKPLTSEFYPNCFIHDISGGCGCGGRVAKYLQFSLYSHFEVKFTSPKIHSYKQGESPVATMEYTDKWGRELDFAV